MRKMNSNLLIFSLFSKWKRESILFKLTYYYRPRSEQPWFFPYPGSLQKSFGKTSCLFVLPLVASFSNKAWRLINFILLFNSFWPYIFCRRLFIFFSGSRKEKAMKKELSNMVVAVKGIRINGDMRIPVLGHFPKIKYMSSIKWSFPSFSVN